MEIVLNAYAKINLALDVLNDRPDGYHDIDTLMQEITLSDTLTIENGRGGFCLTCSNPNLELDETNLVYKAWSLIKDRVDNASVNIHIDKNIPFAAGLGGGSSDAAATLVGLNKLWKLNLTIQELEDLSLQLGSDVPFFIKGHTQRARGRGEILSEVRGVEKYYIIIVNNLKPISSKYIYDNIQNKNVSDVEKLTILMENRSREAFKYMSNHMEDVSFKYMPELVSICNELKALGADVSHMTGSGSTIYGLFVDKNMANEAFKHIEKKYPVVHICETRIN